MIKGKVLQQATPFFILDISNYKGKLYFDNKLALEE